jgi:hypothetical protein
MPQSVLVNHRQVSRRHMAPLKELALSRHLATAGLQDDTRQGGVCWIGVTRGHVVTPI